MSLKGGWQEKAAAYVEEYMRSVDFAAYSIVTVRPLVYDNALQEALNDTYENHILWHLRSVVARDIVGFVAKAMDPTKGAFSLKGLISNVRKQPFWSDLEADWIGQGGVSLLTDQPDGLGLSVAVSPTAFVNQLSQRLEALQSSDKFKKVKGMRDQIVAHLGNPVKQHQPLILPSYDCLFELADEIIEIALQFASFMTCTTPADVREFARVYSEEFWARLSGIEPSRLRFDRPG